MGTDIQAVIEYQQGSYWKFVGFTLNLPRSYRMFATMACVRSSSGPGWGREAMGIPSDVDASSMVFIPQHYVDGYDGPHDPSYMSLSELFTMLQRSGRLNEWMGVLEAVIEEAGYNLDELVLSDFRLIFWFVG